MKKQFKNIKTFRHLAFVSLSVSKPHVQCYSYKFTE